jgi:quinol monooxygenase YgiN
MASILAHITIKPGKERAFEDIIRPLFTRSHAEEKALKRYEYWRGQEPGRYYTLLAFDDYNGFLIHQSSPHHEDAVPALSDVIADIRLEWLDPIQGASPLPPTAPQAVSDNAPDLAKKYAAMIPVAMADWWTDLR